MRGPTPCGTTIEATRAASVRHDQESTRLAAFYAPTLSQDGRLILAADAAAYRRGESNEFARIIDVATGEVVSTLTPHRPNDEPFLKAGVGELVVAQLSPDGKRLLTVFSDRRRSRSQARYDSRRPGGDGPGTVADFQGAAVHTRSRVGRRHRARPVPCDRTEIRGGLGSFSPDGLRILTRSTRGESYCYVQPEDGQVVSTRAHRMADPDVFVRIWDAANGKLLWTVKDRLNPVNEWEGSIAWGADSHSFAASHLLGWLDFENKKLSMPPGISSDSELLFSPNGKYLYSRNSDRAVLIEVFGSGRVRESTGAI